MIERGFQGRLSVATLRSAAAAVGAEYVAELRWRGGRLDRLTDERHARLVGRVVEVLRALAWQVAIEVTYSIYGERGSIDVLALDRGRRHALVVEVKSELHSLEELGRKLDEKARLASLSLIAQRFGVHAVPVGRLVVLPSTDTARRRVARHGAVLAAMLPSRGLDARTWLREPSGAIAGLIFLEDGSPMRRMAGRRGASSPATANSNGSGNSDLGQRSVGGSGGSDGDFVHGDVHR